MYILKLHRSSVHGPMASAQLSALFVAWKESYPYGRDTKLFSNPGLFQELLGELNGYLNVALCIPQLMISVLGGSLISLATLLKQ